MLSPCLLTGRTWRTAPGAEHCTDARWQRQPYAAITASGWRDASAGAAKRGPKPPTSKPTVLCERHGNGACDDDVIQHANVHQRQRLAKP